MNSTSTKSSYNRVVAYGKVLEKNTKSFQRENKDYMFLQLVILCEFYEYITDKVFTKLHVTNVWNPKLLSICETIEVGDTVEVESYVETERNRKDPGTFYHKMNATRVIKIEQ
jgi:hypothetical protein